MISQYFSLANVLTAGATLVVLAMLREVWRSERARRAIERTRNELLAGDREFARARQRERGD